MIKVIITEIDGYNYTLKDNKEKSYKINIEFYGLSSNPTINDVIYINEKLLRFFWCYKIAEYPLK